MTWTLALDLAGTFFFAISGSLLAASRGFDIVGSLMLASFTGLGGGVFRDLIIGRPPVAFDEPIHLLPPVIAAVLVMFLASGVHRLQRVLLVFDAGGLAIFCTTGTVTAIAAGMNPVASVLLGMATGVGGGLLRDVVANRDPQLFSTKDLYAVPAFLGALIIAVLWSVDLLNPVTEYATAAFVFLFRVVSLRFGWHVPRAGGRWTAPPS